ncbi:carboxypeptidase regulatory-like domain-containing protein [Thermoleophilia bacterium SCSIO 60948]|nr:carboxypeptidase regulatory-like domain-containing protein [Thermoleophilia bacterium SCSIO 60948]
MNRNRANRASRAGRASRAAVRAAGPLGLAIALAAVTQVGARAEEPTPAALEVGLYEVVQCASDHRDAPDAQVSAELGYDARSRCDNREDNRTLRIANTSRVTEGRTARIVYVAPPSTEIVAAEVYANLENDGGHNVSLSMADASGSEAGAIANGGQAYDGWRTERWSSPSGTGRARMILRVTCERDVCDRSGDLRASMRNVRLTLRDVAAPEIVRASGSLVEDAWITDEAELGVLVRDSGSGARSIELSVNGDVDDRPSSACDALRDGTALRAKPCAEESETNFGAVVVEAPYSQGDNAVQACAVDFSLQRSCRSYNVRVDSEAPEGYFGEQTEDDPELLRVPVSDSTSGVSSGQIRFRQIGARDWIDLPTSLVDGELRARVDSSSYPEGSYEFEANISDVASNSAATNVKADGSPMVVEFPLRESATVRARIGRNGRGSTIGYGRNSNVSGILVDSSGSPVPGRQVTVTEYFGDGALINARVRQVTTSASGEFTSTLPNGPSRRVHVTYEGDEQYLPDSETAGKLRVKSAATLKISRKKIRPGDRVRFSGRVGRLGARVPPGGKLIELQVQEAPGKFNTIRQAFRTNNRGKFRFKYRFGRFYTEPIRFKFKLKVVREQGWPYVTPVRSRARGLRIKPR